MTIDTKMNRLVFGAVRPTIDVPASVRCDASVAHTVFTRMASAGIVVPSALACASASGRGAALTADARLTVLMVMTA